MKNEEKRKVQRNEKSRTNFTLLNRKLQEQNITLRQLSILTGIGEQTLYIRFDESLPETDGRRRFHDDEIARISEALHLSDCEIYHIFIAGHMHQPEVCVCCK